MALSRMPGRTVLRRGRAAKDWNPPPWGLAAQETKQWAQAVFLGNSPFYPAVTIQRSGKSKLLALQTLDTTLTMTRD